MKRSALDQELDRIYAGPLAEFIASRNDLAKNLRASGDRETADEVKKLAKPSVTAWAVNALYHHERQRFDQLIESAAAVRAALAGKGDRKKAEAARRKALQALLGRAAKLLIGAGHAATPASRQRISHSLETLSARDPEADGPRPGRLTVDLEPQGFDVLAGLAASLAPAAATRKPAPARQPTGRESASPATNTARQRRIEAALQKLREEEAALATLDEQVEMAESAARAASEQHDRLIEEAVEAERVAREAKKASTAARQAVATAKADLTKARASRRRGVARLASAKRQLARHQG